MLDKLLIHFASLLFLCVTGCIHQSGSSDHDKSPEDSSALKQKAESVQSDWLHWRGPAGTGVSEQTGLPEDLNKSLLWTYEIQGGGVPVIAGGKAYQFGYYGVEDELQEALLQSIEEEQNRDLELAQDSTTNSTTKGQAESCHINIDMEAIWSKPATAPTPWRVCGSSCDAGRPRAGTADPSESHTTPAISPRPSTLRAS